MSKALIQADSSTSTQDARLIRELILPGELERSSSSMVHGREDYVVDSHSRTRSSSLCSLLSWADVSVCSREVRYFFFFPLISGGFGVLDHGWRRRFTVTRCGKGRDGGIIG